jgi:hypothetical protein
MNDSELNPSCKASKTIDLVTGGEEYSGCRSMRKPRASCGVSAKLFIEKLQNDESKKLK